MKKLIAVVIVAGVLSAGWVVYEKHEVRRAVARATQAKRDAAYQAVLAQFQRDLQLWMPRSGVEKYLDSRSVFYTTDGNGDIQQKIGQEPGDGFTCDRWSVYVDFHFSRAQSESEVSEFDHLSSIAISKIGHCL
jgi:type II secretory pathway component PulJ